MKQHLIAFAVIFFLQNSYGQNEKKPAMALNMKKRITASRIKTPISIDGILDEKEWENAETAKNFVMFDPDNGKAEKDNLKTEVKIIYDNHSVYVGAVLYDSEPDKILKEITERDNIGAADFFGVFINGFNDGQQEYSFFVTASNGQGDCIRTQQQGEDFSWDAIWMSQARITDKGWLVEMKIPYAALRFSKDAKQTWGIQFFREVRRLRQKFTWNPVDNKIGTFTQQTGLLDGLENIETPTRLFLMPYLSYYMNSPADIKAKGTLKGGMDLKYGVTDAFTLDAILIPDFGQTKFDNQILNLGPFEQQFNENRPFFTEGTDLFSKGNLFYSRRIGGTPKFDIDLAEDEYIEKYPGNIQLINALKLSGRTGKGLGVGILNAVTETTNVTVVKRTPNSNPDLPEKLEKRRETLEPLTNYNVFVLDKRFQNSSISFINTNVMRDGSWQDANAYALVFDLNTKKNTFNLSGASKHSIVQIDKTGKYSNGYANDINFTETTGKIRFNVGAGSVSKEYNVNDLGINFLTNYYEIYGNINYRTLKPTDKLNSFRINFNTYQQHNLQSNYLQDQNFNVNAHFTNKKNHGAGIGFNANPFKRFNYYDPRVEGRYVIYPKNYNMWAYISTNYNNKFAFDTNPNIGFAEQKGWWFYYLDFAPRYRFSNKLMLVLRNSVNNEFNDLGWVANDNGTIVFAKRNRLTYELGLEGKYSINSRMNFNLNTRYYWSYAENKSFYKLNDNGYTSAYNFTGNRNSDFKSLNTDLSFSWWFAPGSQMTVLYRNNAADFSRNVNKKFIQNFESVLNQDKLNNTFSISVKYFIDYNQAKHWL
ncbi:DUF5916 domain-containing protein [Flavobacterium sp. H122]|uniref:DUF5916 domain-containing protein n=1 Tax=Flavobacterium sp. H122 TaxID=2529860 RepID=UPI0010AA8086|nr:DUF5916 domain-containing protein [Flavobacterium sp. H122]